MFSRWLSPIIISAAIGEWAVFNRLRAVPFPVLYVFDTLSGRVLSPSVFFVFALNLAIALQIARRALSFVRAPMPTVFVLRAFVRLVSSCDDDVRASVYARPIADSSLFTDTAHGVVVSFGYTTSGGYYTLYACAIAFVESLDRTTPRRATTGLGPRSAGNR